MKLRQQRFRITDSPEIAESILEQRQGRTFTHKAMAWIIMCLLGVVGFFARDWMARVERFDIQGRGAIREAKDYTDSIFKTHNELDVMAVGRIERLEKTMTELEKTTQETAINVAAISMFMQSRYGMPAPRQSRNGSH